MTFELQPSAIEALSTSQIEAEMVRLELSISHLNLSNDDLRAFIAEGQDLQQVIDENQEVIGAQRTRIQTLAQAFKERTGHWPKMASLNSAIQTEIDGSMHL